MSELPTSAAGSSSSATYPTPTASSYGSTLARRGDLWPTATATDAKASGAAGYSTASGRHSGTTLTDATARMPGPHSEGITTAGESGSRPAIPLRLSPDFVELLMGFPAGWTVIDKPG